MGKLHGTLAKAGKVRKQTPKIEKTVKHKIPKGRAFKRILYNRKFANKVAQAAGGPQMKQKSPNWHAGRKELIEEDKKKAKAQKEQRAQQKQRK